MKSKKNLIKVGIILIILTMILPTIAETATVTNSNTTPDNNPLVLADTTPPKVQIKKPVKGVYIVGNKIFPRLIRLTLIIGSITIEVNATDNESGIDRVEFYGGLRGKKYLGNATTEPFTYNLKRGMIKLIHIQKIKVVAYDKANNSASDKIWVRKIL